MAVLQSSVHVQVTLELGESEASMHASIHALQLDDQSLDAQQPVVLGPASVVSKGTPPYIHTHAMHACTYVYFPHHRKKKLISYFAYPGGNGPERSEEWGGRAA